MRATKPAPIATREELNETIAQLRAKRADGWTVGNYEGEYWTAEMAPVAKTGKMVWGILRIALAPDGSDKVRHGQRVVLKGSKGNLNEGEQWHINEATKKNRALLKRAIKILSARVTGVEETVV